ncbi:MAG: two-component sensor histidine kinase [Kineosporiaceae bacterium]|nr:two-component sensor histidine kinase [Kineosporiaceae bacterium]
MASLAFVDLARASAPTRSGAARATVIGAAAGLVLVWLVDLLSLSGTPHRGLWWLPAATGPVAVAYLMVTRRRAWLEWSALLLATASLGLTALTGYTGWAYASWSLVEMFCLWALLVRLARSGHPPARALVFALLLSLAVIALPVRTGLGVGSDVLTFAFLLTLVTAAIAGTATYLRTMDDRRRRALTQVRQAERLQLARDLHDLVAHHVTGIVVQAQAARTIQAQSPDQIEPILARIEHAGLETLQSMRQLVGVLRTEDSASQVRRGDLLVDLAELTAAAARNGGPGAQLDVDHAVRSLHLTEPMCATVIRVVQEGLTNARRHAPGSPARVALTVRADQLSVEVRNPTRPGRAGPPIGGRGGFGLIGLRERVEAVGGRLQAGPDGEREWALIATLPLTPSPT